MNAEQTLLKTIGERLKERREELGISQRRLAADLDMDERQLRRIEHGEASLRVVVLHRLTQQLKTNVLEFLQSIPQVNPQQS